MMYQCIQLAAAVDLASARRYWGLSNDPDTATRAIWPYDSIVLKQQALSEFLCLEAGDREIHVFAQGYLVFVGCETALITATLRQLLRILPTVPASPSRRLAAARGTKQQLAETWLDISEMADLDRVTIDDPAVRLAAAVLLPVLLVRSCELQQLEARLKQLLDQEIWLFTPVNDRQIGRNNKQVRQASRQAVLCQYAILRQDRRDDRLLFGLAGPARRAADLLADYLELPERRQVYGRKLDHFTQLSRRQSGHRSARTMLRLYWFEVALLILFPLLYWLGAAVFR